MRNQLRKLDLTDALLVLGIALIAMGAGMVYVPAGVIVAGVGCIAVYVLLSLASGQPTGGKS